MRTHEVSFFSEGSRVSALWRVPDSFHKPLRAIVQGPGWLGLKDARLYVRYHQALTDAGFGVLVFDYRGFGDSEGNKQLLSADIQVRDLVNAVTYLTTRDDVDADALGAFGSGGTGGGNAVILGAMDKRIRAIVSQLPVADGADWLHRMRSEHEWLSFLQALAEDRQTRVLTGSGRLVNPREEIMVPTPERRATSVKADVDHRIPSAVSLASTDEILSYRPVDSASILSTPLLVIGIEDDATTPTDHAIRVFEAARGPKALIMQRHTTHYAAYDQYWSVVTPRIVEWFDRYLRNGEVVMYAGNSSRDVVEFLGGSP